MGRPKKEKPNRVNGIYEVKVTIGHNFDGTPIRKSFYSKISKEAAKAKAEQYKIELAVYDITGETPQSNDISFEIWAMKVLESLKGTVKGSTYELHYRNTIENHLIPHFKNAKMKRIRQIDAQSYFNKLQDTYSLETLKIHKMVLHKIFAAAVQNDIINKNPCDDIRLKSTVPKQDKHTYTESECELVLKYAETHPYGLEITLMLSYGISRSELLGIQWDDIDAHALTLHIQRGVAEVKNVSTGKVEVVVGDLKNIFRERVIPITESVLKQIMEQPKTCVYLFGNQAGKPQCPNNWRKRRYNVFMRDMHQYYAEQGKDIPILTPHELRHTRASLWVNSGANLFAVANVLGHADLQMLRKRCAHSDVEATRKLLGLDRK